MLALYRIANESMRCPWRSSARRCRKRTPHPVTIKVPHTNDPPTPLLTPLGDQIPFDPFEAESLRAPKTASVSSAAVVDMLPEVAPAKPPPLGGPYTLPGVTDALFPSRERRHSACTGICEEDPVVQVPLVAPVQVATSVLSVVPPIITPVLSGAGERDRIITPYRADALEAKLRQYGLLDKYPQLPDRFRYGFPIGDFQPLKKTYTPKNHSSAYEHLDFIRQYVAEQVSLNRMSGPYTAREVQSKLKSHFMTSPLGVVDKAGSPGKYRLIQNCSFKNEDGFSVDDFIDANDFPTTWGTAAEVAQIVSHLSLW